jgi:AraC family transcriptional regulator
VTQFRAALDSIAEHRDAAVTLRDLAAVVHRGPSPLARTFPAPTGLPPHRSVVARPIERAKQFQRGGDDFSLAQVAARSGSRDQGHFTRRFTRLVGVTPKHFR